MTGVMDGVRVLEVAQWWFVPAAGAVLSDWGADVIKVEHPATGDPQRGLMTSGLVPNTGGVNYMMEQSNRGKRSVGLDLATDAGRELLYKLAAGSDVFLTNFLPDARERLRIDVDDIRSVNPDIVYVRGHGQGARGPDAGKGGYDAASFWCRGGLSHALTPPNARAPVMQRAAYGDSVGAMTIAGGIAAALFGRERGHAPEVVDISLFGTAMWMTAPDVLLSTELPADMPKFSRESPPNPVVNSYRTSDGRWLQLNMIQPDPYWEDLCEHLNRPDLVTDERFADAASRFEHRRECVAELDEIIGGRTLAEWRERFSTLKGVWAPMQSARELHDDPQAIDNGYFTDVEGADGVRFKLIANPVQFDGTSPQLRPAPAHGEQTDEVLLELGLSYDEILEHKVSGAVL
jgi:crotonobetainyl-CoA:carnitine CoA-transferase CaiB-like acyl-CoA transferase